MKKIIPFDLENDQIFVEVEDDYRPEGVSEHLERGEGAAVKGAGQFVIERLERGDGAALKGAERFVEAIAKVKPAAEALFNSLREMNAPDEIGLEFGVKFNAKVGAILASADSEATFKVSLKWVQSKR